MVSDSLALRAIPPRGYVRAHAAFGASVTDAPLIYHVVTALSVLAAALPTDTTCPIYGGQIAATLCSLIVGPSGGRKSHAIRLGADALREIAPERASDGTSSYEGLFVAVAARPRQLLVHSELGSWLAHSARGYAQPVRELYIQLADGDPIEQRLARSTRRIAAPRVSIVAACTPALLSAHTTPTDWAGGLMGRFLTVLAERTRFLGTPADGSARRAVALDLLRARAATPLGPCDGIAEEALPRWQSWTSDLDARWRRDPHDAAASAAVRTPIMALRAALLYGIDLGAADGGAPWRITEEHLEPAIALAEMHLSSVIELAEQIAASPYARQRQQALSALATLGRPARRGEIMRTMADKIDARQAARILEALVEEGLVVLAGSTPQGPTYALAGHGVPLGEQSAQEPAP